MSTQIDRVVSEVVAEPEPPTTEAGAATGTSKGEVLTCFEVRRAAMHEDCIMRRTRAEGFDD